MSYEEEDTCHMRRRIHAIEATKDDRCSENGGATRKPKTENLNPKPKP
jgi:hypothetical protein